VNLVSKTQAAEWCLERGLAGEGSLPATRITFRDGFEQRIRIPVSGSPGEIVTMAYVLLMSDVPDDDERQFAGGLLWLQDWDIWSETTERVGLLLLRGSRCHAKPDYAIKDRPAELFDGSEFPAAQAALALPLMFQWDAYFVPLSGSYFVYSSHHGHVDVVVQDGAQQQAFLRRFEEAGLRPAVVAAP
jgi:hypothetical protein